MKPGQDFEEIQRQHDRRVQLLIAQAHVDGHSHLNTILLAVAVIALLAVIVIAGMS